MGVTVWIKRNFEEEIMNFKTLSISCMIILLGLDLALAASFHWPMENPPPPSVIFGRTDPPVDFITPKITCEASCVNYSLCKQLRGKEDCKKYHSKICNCEEQ